jgi:hypothetical protein
MFELISRRYEQTNRPFAEWREVLSKRRLRSSPSSIGSFIMPKSSPSRGSRIVSKRPTRDLHSGQTSRRQTVKPPFSSTGLPRPTPLAIAATWAPEQALAVVELLDHLRDRIWAHYDVKLFDLIREQRLPRSAEQFDEPSF